VVALADARLTMAMDEDHQQNAAPEGLEGIKAELRILGDRFSQLDRSLGHVISTSRIGYDFVATLLSLAVVMSGFLGATVYNLNERLTQTQVKLSEENTSLGASLASLDKNTGFLQQSVGNVTQDVGNLRQDVSETLGHFSGTTTKLATEVDDLKHRVDKLEANITK
jgi:methyl-accepting chemotaxis protein